MLDLIREEAPKMIELEEYQSGLGNGQVIFRTECELPQDFWEALLSVARDFICQFERCNAMARGRSCDNLPGEQRNVSFAFDLRRLDDQTYTLIIMPEYGLVREDGSGPFLTNQAYENHFLSQFSWICLTIEEYLDRFFNDPDGYAAVRQLWQPGEVIPPGSELHKQLWQIRDRFAVKAGYRQPSRSERLAEAAEDLFAFPQRFVQKQVFPLKAAANEQ